LARIDLACGGDGGLIAKGKKAEIPTDGQGRSTAACFAAEL